MARVIPSVPSSHTGGCDFAMNLWRTGLKTAFSATADNVNMGIHKSRNSAQAVPSTT